MEAHLIEWLNLSIRWTHIITGIAWIGASFYFNFLENSLNRTQDLRKELAGNLWAIHGGGFYYLEKYKHSPKTIPQHLHWFKWEAYFTLISGLALLVVVYYFNASVYMIDPKVADIGAFTAISISIIAIIASWIIYDLLCKSTLIKKPRLFALIGFVLLILLTFLLNQYLSSRATYIHIGAIIGTLMVLNVFFVIIPSQKTMVNAAKQGVKSDPTLGKKALMRSIHNNYMTLPVLFIMISNHFPSTYGHKHGWAILSGMILVGVSIRHWFNLKGKGTKNWWLLPLASAIFILLFFLTLNKNELKTSNSKQSKLTDYEAFGLINEHCSSCHSSEPTSTLFTTAPKGVMFDKFEDIILQSDSIKAQTVNAQIMPLGNLTQMTSKERQQLGQWLDQL